ncbi:hypothetical protein [Methanosphaera cuniculi]|uniref:hypothetical protein n=1 Tax=Methanosphaera cuniculi TaxID=1077256 RepID=UPI0026EFD887|nr:hypothetical protein [Methanosphaera cuniculi]
MEENEISNKKLIITQFFIILVVILTLTTINAEDNITDDVKLQTHHETPTSSINYETHKEKQPIIEDTTETKMIKKDGSENVELTCYDVDAYVDNIIEIPYETTKPLDDGIMTYYINRNMIGIQNLSDEHDIFTYNITGYDEGSYDLKLEYIASDKYMKTFTTATLNVYKYATQTENMKITLNDENNIDITFNLRSNNQFKNTGTIILYDNTTEVITHNITEDDIKITIPASYNYQILTLIYSGDRYSESLNISQLIYAQKHNLTLFMPSIRGYHEDIINSTITLNTTRNLNDGFLNIYIDDTLYQTINVTSKTITANFNLTKYLEGRYNIQLQYVGSNIFTDSTYNTTLTVNRINTRLYANNITTYKNNTINLTVSVTNYIDHKADGIVEFILANENIKTQMINDTKITFNYPISDNLEYGKHELLILYHGTNRYNPSNLTVNLNICKYPLNIYIRNTTFNEDENIIVNLQFSSYIKENITDGVADIYLNDKYITSANVTSNLTSIILDKNITPNSYDMKIFYHNSTCFNDTTRNQKINISKINTTLKISQYLMNKNILNITTIIYAKDYSNITSGLLQIKLDNKIIYMQSIKNNINSIFYDMKNETITNHTITATYNGTNKYQPITNKTHFNYTPHKTTIYIKTNNTIRSEPNKIITINATINDYQSNIINETLNTTIQIKNTQIQTQFINGTLTYQYKTGNKDENTTITITINPTAYYKSTNRNITLITQRNSTYINTNTNIHATKDENITINATLNSNQKLLKGKILTIIKINQNTIKQTYFIDGILQITLPLKELYNDNYQITLKTQPTNQYQQAEKNITLTLNKRRTYIRSNNIQIPCTDTAIINATIYDQLTNKPITHKIQYTIKINQVTHTKNTTENAHILYKYTNTYPKIYTLTIISGENGLYTKSTWNGTINITIKKLEIQTQNIKTLAKKKITINAQLFDKNKKINTTVNVAIKINGKTITTLKTSNGIINYTYQLTYKYSAKIHNLTIVASATQYMRSETTVKLIINKLYPQIKSQNITAKPNTTIHIKADIQLSNKNIDETIKVNIKLSRKNICTINVTRGKIDYKYMIPSNFKPGIYEILIQSSETSIYHHVTIYTKLKVVT